MDWGPVLITMVVEFIVLVVLFDLYLLWRYNKGCIHWIVVKCSRDPKGNYNIAKVSHFQSLQVSCLIARLELHLAIASSDFYPSLTLSTT